MRAFREILPPVVSLSLRSKQQQTAAIAFENLGTSPVLKAFFSNRTGRSLTGDPLKPLDFTLRLLGGTLVRHGTLSSPRPVGPVTRTHLVRFIFLVL